MKRPTLKLLCKAIPSVATVHDRGVDTDRDALKRLVEDDTRQRRLKESEKDLLDAEVHLIPRARLLALPNTAGSKRADVRRAVADALLGLPQVSSLGFDGVESAIIGDPGNYLKRIDPRERRLVVSPSIEDLAPAADSNLDQATSNVLVRGDPIFVLNSSLMRPVKPLRRVLVPYPFPIPRKAHPKKLTVPLLNTIHSMLAVGGTVALMTDSRPGFNEVILPVIKESCTFVGWGLEENGELDVQRGDFERFTHEKAELVSWVLRKVAATPEMVQVSNRGVPCWRHPSYIAYPSSWQVFSSNFLHSLTKSVCFV